MTWPCWPPGARACTVAQVQPVPRRARLLAFVVLTVRRSAGSVRGTQKLAMRHAGHHGGFQFEAKFVLACVHGRVSACVCRRPNHGAWRARPTLPRLAGDFSLDA